MTTEEKVGQLSGRMPAVQAVGKGRRLPLGAICSLASDFRYPDAGQTPALNFFFWEGED